MKSKRFEYRGLIVVLAVYLLMAAVLFAERTGIQYKAMDYSTAYLDESQIVLAQDAYAAQTVECLVLYNSEDTGSMLALEQFEQIFLDMKVRCSYINVAVERLPDLIDYKTVTVLLSDLSPVGVDILELTNWVHEGGKALFAMTLEKEPTFMLIEQKLGILDSELEKELVESIAFAEDFIVGGSGKTWNIIDGFDSALRVSLHDQAQVYAWDGDEKACPLIWKNEYGAGCFVVSNFGLYEKTMRGLYAMSYSLLEEAFAYPVINGSTFYLDDFPAPVPSGDGHYIRADYGMSIEEFYMNIWWPDMLELGEKYDVRFISGMIETYDDETEEGVFRQTEMAHFKHYGDLLLRAGGEIGYHGYNHQPLCLGNVEYGEVLPYNTWPSIKAMEEAVSELIAFVDELFPQSSPSVYIPPSNVLSAEGRALLSSNFPHIRTIASNYNAGDMAYVQEFEVSADGIVEQPRIISGLIINDYMQLTALSELNMHFVNTHFTHPDDVLDEARGAALGWEELRNTMDEYMSWLYTSAPGLRNMTGSELSGAIQRFGSLSLHREITAGEMRLTIDNLIDEAYLMVRLTDGENIICTGGELQQLTSSLYLLRATQKNVIITWDR